MQTDIKTHQGERWHLAYDIFDGMLYRQVRATPVGPLDNQFLHKCRVIDGQGLEVAWRDYLAAQRGEGRPYMVLADPATQRILYPED